LPFNASASPRTIAITSRATVIQTSAIGPGVRTERCRLLLSDRRVVPARRLMASPGLFGVHARRPRG
jgi:hypothetical protein